jgi:hypothetical protein
MAAPVVLALGACTSLEAVKGASAKLVGASKSWGAVAQELDATCERQMQFNPALTDCQSAKDASKRLGDANAVLTAYFQALADAASDQNFTIQPGLDAAAKSAAAIPGLDKDEASAAADLVSLLGQWATAALRERALRHLIEGGVPPSERLIAVMDHNVVHALRTDLATERDQLDATFLGYVYPAGGRRASELQALCPAGPRAYDFRDSQAFLAALEYCRRAADLKAKSEAVDDYQKSLAAAQATLADLASSKSRLKSKELATQLYNMGKALDAKVEAVSKAFSKEQGR